ncbi:MAG: hypothetical protein ABH890_02570 [Bacillota bacterium]
MNMNDFFITAQEPWVRYRYLIDIMNLSIDDPRAISAKNELLNHPHVRLLIEELKLWPGQPLNSHKSASQLYHKLVFLADLGLTDQDLYISLITQKVCQNQTDEGLYTLPNQISVAHGGTNEILWAWALCDAPLLLYAVHMMSPKKDQETKKGVNYLLNLGRENGYPCVVSSALGNFRGPGRKSDPCPYATLIMLKLISCFDELKMSTQAKGAVESLLNLWETSKQNHPYIFYMGHDFRKLKAPLIWYDILHVCDVLSHFDYARSDYRFKEMIGIITSKQNEMGLYTAESIWLPFRAWDFGQKKSPSLWITF